MDRQRLLLLLESCARNLGLSDAEKNMSRLLVEYLLHNLPPEEPDANIKQLEYTEEQVRSELAKLSGSNLFLPQQTMMEEFPAETPVQEPIFQIEPEASKVQNPSRKTQTKRKRQASEENDGTTNSGDDSRVESLNAPHKQQKGSEPTTGRSVIDCQHYEKEAKPGSSPKVNFKKQTSPIWAPAKPVSPYSPYDAERRVRLFGLDRHPIKNSDGQYIYVEEKLAAAIRAGVKIDQASDAQLAWGSFTLEGFEKDLLNPQIQRQGRLGCLDRYYRWEVACRGRACEENQTFMAPGQSPQLDDWLYRPRDDDAIYYLERLRRECTFNAQGVRISTQSDMNEFAHLIRQPDMISAYGIPQMPALYDHGTITQHEDPWQYINRMVMLPAAPPKYVNLGPSANVVASEPITNVDFHRNVIYPNRQNPQVGSTRQPVTIIDVSCENYFFSHQNNNIRTPNLGNHHRGSTRVSAPLVKGHQASPIYQLDGTEDLFSKSDQASNFSTSFEKIDEPIEDPSLFVQCDNMVVPNSEGSVSMNIAAQQVSTQTDLDFKAFAWGTEDSASTNSSLLESGSSSEGVMPWAQSHETATSTDEVAFDFFFSFPPDPEE